VDQDRAGINQTRSAYVAAWNGADADQMANLYTPDALVLYPNQPAVVGRSAILVYFKAFFAEFTQEDFELTSEEIEIVGPWAFDRGKYLVILRRQPDGSWKVARDMDNSDRPLAQTARGAA